VTLATLIALLPLVLGLAGSQSDPAMPAVGRLIGERDVILRVPVRPQAMGPRLTWVEGDRFKCVKTKAIRGGVLGGNDHVDLVLPKRKRVRASFAGNCPALDFYDGFYLKTEDDRVCAGRDFVHSRMGGSCRIEELRHLAPRLRD
jgi:hypothetical protein